MYNAIPTIRLAQTNTHGSHVNLAPRKAFQTAL
uniref:Uncharacterized protein n=1 Tax=Anguilla anguilla TaxID=7936 RepID=A0A0E9RMJ8_ANGAN